MFKECGWLKERQQQRTDSTHILAKIRAINRRICVGEAMRFALNSLAVVAGDWLLAHGGEEWVYRYGHRIEEARLPSSRAEREKLAEVIGRDGASLLEALFDPAAPALLRQVPAVEILRQIWVQIIGGRMGKSEGCSMRIFLRRHALSVLLTITRHATAKSGVRAFRGIQSASHGDL